MCQIGKLGFIFFNVLVFFFFSSFCVSFHDILTMVTMKTYFVCWNGIQVEI